MNIMIENGRIIDPANKLDSKQTLYISDSIILAIGDKPGGFTAERVIDASKQIICPGLVDLRAHCREPGHEYKATIASETHAAAAGGITTLCCPPDTLPVVDTPAVATLIRERAEAAGAARVLPLAAMTRGLKGQLITEMHALKQVGCPGISNGMHNIASLQILRRAMEYATSHDITVFLHAEDSALRNDGCIHEGPVSTRLGLAGIPEAAETAAVGAYLALIAQTGARAHFSMLSSARAVQMIGRARHDGLNVTADVSAHHLQLTELDVLDFDSQCHVRPPLRSQRDSEALAAGIKSGIISAICSDHQPHEADAKLAPFAETAAGISSLETLLPLTLRLVDNNTLSLSEAIATLTCNPAQILGITAGTLSVGQAADICIFDPEQYWTVSPASLRSRGHNTPFMGWELKGQVSHTLLDGHVTHEHGEVLT